MVSDLMFHPLRHRTYQRYAESDTLVAKRPSLSCLLLRICAIDTFIWCACFFLLLFKTVFKAYDGHFLHFCGIKGSVRVLCCHFFCYR